MEQKSLIGLYELNRCVQWIQHNHFQKVFVVAPHQQIFEKVEFLHDLEELNISNVYRFVSRTTCLQFPDYLLCHSRVICQQIQAKCASSVYILADTLYESCCIDYVAAQHVHADSIIHFGPVCISKTCSPVPFLTIFEKANFNVDEFMTSLSKVYFNEKEPILLVYDLQFEHVIDLIRNESEKKQVELTICSLLDLKKIREIVDKYVIVCYLGSNDRKLFTFKNSFNFGTKKFYFVDSNEKFNFVPNFEVKTTKRSNFLVAKIRKAKTIGLLLSTISVQNSLKVVERIKKLCRLHKKSFYVISIGKINAAKLANFLEIEVFVLISCPLNSAYDCTDFYQPVASVFDCETALNDSGEMQQNFLFDFDEILKREIRIDLLENCNDSDCKELLPKDNFEIGINLQSRTWTGLQINHGDQEASLVEEGQSGIASGYQHEAKL